MGSLLLPVLLLVIIGSLLKPYFEVREKENQRQREIREAALNWARSEERQKMRVEQGLKLPMNSGG